MLIASHRCPMRASMLGVSEARFRHSRAFRTLSISLIVLPSIPGFAQAIPAAGVAIGATHWGLQLAGIPAMITLKATHRRQTELDGTVRYVHVPILSEQTAFVKRFGRQFEIIF